MGALTSKFRKLEAEIASSSSSESSDSEPDNKVEEMVDGLKKRWRRIRGKESSRPSSPSSAPANSDVPPHAAAGSKIPMSLSLISLLVYTVGVKFRGFNSGVPYAPEHICSLSENAVNRLLRGRPPSTTKAAASSIEVGLVAAASAGRTVSGVAQKEVTQNQSVALVNHTRGHVVRTYPKGTRIGSTNYKPHRFWAIGAQVVALNWQTFDLGYVMNMAMFQRNGRAGYILKPAALRPGGEELLRSRTRHTLDVTIISAQQLPCGQINDGDDIPIVDPFVQVTLHIPDWKSFVPSFDPTRTRPTTPIPGTNKPESDVASCTVTQKTRAVKRNGFNPVWQETMSLPFDCAGGGTEMRDLIFVEFLVKQEGKEDEDIAAYCTPLSCLEMGYRYLPLHDSQRKQYMFSTLFVRIDIRDVM